MTSPTLAKPNFTMNHENCESTLPDCELSTISSVTNHLQSASFPIHGTTIDQSQNFSTPLEMWTHLLSSPTKRAWYDRTSHYYDDEIPPTVDGMLGGLAAISPRDLAASRDFLHAAKEATQGRGGGGDDDAEWRYCCDCGAGIGRVSKELLLPFGFERCDLVEANEGLICEAGEFLGEEGGRKCRFFLTGLQDFEPRVRSYDVVWIQWVIGYLTDDDCVAFLRRCGESLREGGVVVIKDNCCESRESAFCLDVDDGFVNRSVEYVKALISLSGLTIILEKVQDDFPDEIFPVPMFACQLKDMTK